MNTVCRSLTILSALLLIGCGICGADTFSIVAVDPVTGQVGSAGASCISGSIIISDVHPGVGAIHTQSYWNGTNQNNAHNLMDQGYSPQEIIDWLVANDVSGNPSIRQYGVVDLVGGGRSAAFTGEGCLDHKGHILGPNYAIQGNILLGPEVLEQMEIGFLTTIGSLADKLMAAIQGANIPGADRRCLDDGKSSISAFIRLAQPDDSPSDLYLDLNVNNTGPGEEPIDLLQALYDEWKLQATSAPGMTDRRPAVLELAPIQPNPFDAVTTILYRLPEPVEVELGIFDLQGREILSLSKGRQEAGAHRFDWDARGVTSTGVYFVTVRAGSTIETRKVLLLRE